MLNRVWRPLVLAVVLGLTGCKGAPSDSAKLTLRNPTWKHVNVQVVITKSANCDDRGPEFVSTRDFEMVQEKSIVVFAPNGTSVCWRHDRFPDNPQPGQWSGWSRAVLFPDASTEADL
jgi:hypothetical protein